MFSPILIHVPHASTVIPQKARERFRCSDLTEELRLMTDWYVDELFSCGEEQLRFSVSRLVCDPERFRDDADEPMSAVGMGAVYTSCADGSPLRRITDRQREEILRHWYDPHHRRFEESVTERLTAFGHCLIIDAHSFYPTALPYERNDSALRPDICIGTDTFHTPPELAAQTAEFFADAGYSTAMNTPFAGAIVPIKYYCRDRRVLSIMIEVNRRLYLDERAGTTPGFEKLHRDICRWVGLQRRE